MNLLPELNALVLIHDRPDVTEAAVVDGAFDDDGNDTGEHETRLNHVRPHHSFHTTLETRHTERNSQLLTPETQSACRDQCFFVD